jgi:DNA-binding NtrC family response regulator
MKVLVVDDERTMRDMAAQILRSAGYVVDSAVNGDAALARLSEGFDILLTDLDMPGSLNGIELTRRARSQWPVDALIMTGFPDLNTAIQAVKSGAYDYLVKPFTPEVLRMAVDRCADKRRLSLELAREKTLRAELDRAYAELSRAQQIGRASCRERVS